MSHSCDTDVMEELIDPVARCFTPEVARRVLNLRASPQLQAKLDELAEKCSEGRLTQQEIELYESYLRGMNFIGVLQASARAQLGSVGLS